MLYHTQVRSMSTAELIEAEPCPEVIREMRNRLRDDRAWDELEALVDFMADDDDRERLGAFLDKWRK